MLYPQNGSRIVAIDMAMSLHAVYWHICMSALLSHAWQILVTLVVN